MPKISAIRESSPTGQSRKAEHVVEKLLYDVESAAYALSLSKRTIKTMIANKQLSYRRYGRKNLIPAADIRRVAKLEQLQEA